MDQFSIVTSAAHDGSAGLNGLPAPTAEQARAGNYRKGRVVLHGLRIAIETPQGQRRTGKEDGELWSVICQAHYGYIEGTRGADGDELDVFVGPWPESQMAYIVNRAKPDDSGFDEHKILIGFPDMDSAVLAYRNSYERGAAGDQSGLGTIPCTISQLKWWIEFGNHTIPLTPSQLPFDGAELMNETAWDSTANPVGVTVPRLMYAMRRHDGGDHLLLDSVSVEDVLEASDGEAVLDALVIPLNQLERKLGQMQVIMRAASKAVRPIGMQVTPPFKQRGTTNVAGIFEMSDGQTITVYFHNPDATPNKLTPDDEMVSWKWMLNKKDVTIVVAPERGRDLNPREIARRIMRLVEVNSNRFTTANAKRSDRMAAIAAGKAAVEAKQAQYDTLAAEIVTLEARVADKRNQHVATLQSRDPDQPVADEGTETVPTAAEIPAAPAPTPAAVVQRGGAGPLPAGWTESQPGGMATNLDPLNGGIVDSAFVTGEWFIVFNDSSIQGVQEGFATRADAFAALADALARRDAAKAEAFDPTSAGGYSQVMASEDLQLQNQDHLDAFFGSRSIGVRNALRERGWKGASNGPRMFKGSAEARWEWFQVGVGRNVVGYAVHVGGQTLRDDLTMSDADFAGAIDAAASTSTNAIEIAAAALVKAAAGGVARLGTSKVFTFDYQGDDVVFTPELRAGVETILQERVKEVVLPGLEGQVSIVPESFQTPSQPADSAADGLAAPKYLYETGNDESSWNSAVQADGDQFRVLVWDADGDQRDDLALTKPDLDAAKAYADSIVTNEGQIVAARQAALVRAMAFLATVIDGTADLSDPTLADKLGELFESYGGVDEFDAMFSRAVDAYQEHVVELAKKAL